MKDFSDPNNGLDMLRAKRSLTGLGLCADDAAKQLLLDIASQSSDVMDIRMRALAAYLQASNAEEAKNVLLRFLVEEERMDDYARSSIYVYAKTVWDTASPEKKEAIFNALCVAASMESTQWVFEECDTRLIAMNASYKNSLQREAMLRRQLFIPFSKYYNELKIQMEKEVKRLEKVKNHSNISTNLAALKTRNFNLPQPDLATNNVIAAVEGSTVADEKTDSRTIRSVGMYAFFGVTTLLLLGLGAWKMTRR